MRRKRKNSERICIFVEALFYICLVLNSFTPFKYKARKDNPWKGIICERRILALKEYFYRISKKDVNIL